MTAYTTKDSGARITFDTGMVRDTTEGKPRFDLLVPLGQPYREQMLTRFADLMARGAAKYGDRNWEKAATEVELARARQSAARHFMQWLMGEGDEDHAAAVWFNIMEAELVVWKLRQADASPRPAGIPDLSGIAGEFIIDMTAAEFDAAYARLFGHPPGQPADEAEDAAPEGDKADYRSPEVWAEANPRFDDIVSREDFEDKIKKTRENEDRTQVVTLDEIARGRVNQVEGILGFPFDSPEGRRLFEVYRTTGGDYEQVWAEHDRIMAEAKAPRCRTCGFQHPEKDCPRWSPADDDPDTPVDYWPAYFTPGTPLPAIDLDEAA